MQSALPSYLGGHALALAGVLSLHTGIAAWAMAPDAPVVIPEQQIIQVSMVAPTSIARDEVIRTPQEQKRPTPNVAPKETGMVSAQPPVKTPSTEERKAKPQQDHSIVQKQTQLTSGIQDANATERQSAVTKPMAANYLKNPPPPYPHTARKRKQQGVVMLDVLVTSEGMAKRVIIERSSGHEVLDEAALSAVKRWRFVPARRGSQLIEASVVVPIEFKIN